MKTFRLGMEKMSAIRERRDLLDRTQKAFSLRCKNFLSSKFVYHVRLLIRFDDNVFIVVFRLKNTAIDSN